ncbi:DUF4222 domain-containing protein [Salmonella enterica]|nr:DUF4222 domain-containing protein [Salmonella enterica]
MKKLNSGLTASSSVRAEIHPGDIYRDGHGDIVTVRTATPERVTYTRNGYSFDCVSSRMRFEKEFTPVKKQTFQEWASHDNPWEKIKALWERINGSRDHQRKENQESEE